MNTLLLALAMALSPSADEQDTMRTRATMRAKPAEVSGIIAGWRAEPKKVAKKMIDKYGQPHEASETHLVWWGNGPWKYTIIENIEIPHDFPMPHKDLLRQVIDYKVPADKVDDLAVYDGSVIFDRTPGELSARCDKEEANFLAINLAHDVVTGRRSARAARDFYARAVMAMMKKNQTAEQKRYMSGFVFPMQKNTGFKDKKHGM
jgi:hypothetical protein